jgi:hypothetical protein
VSQEAHFLCSVLCLCFCLTFLKPSLAEWAWRAGENPGPPSCCTPEIPCCTTAEGRGGLGHSAQDLQFIFYFPTHFPCGLSHGAGAEEQVNGHSRASPSSHGPGLPLAYVNLLHYG